jgi:hypothetical protein
MRLCILATSSLASVVMIVQDLIQPSGDFHGSRNPAMSIGPRLPKGAASAAAESSFFHS